jgi:eukaryotic-like serine/threonine-protein kinase
MIYCLNPDCENPQNPNNHNYCHSCGARLSLLLKNRFKILKALGRGGFGQTYLAEDTDKLHRLCVIKQLLAQGLSSKCNPKVVELFIREAEQLDLLKEHKQIPDLLAYFRENGYLYLAQDYVDGQDLLQELQHQGPFSEDKILDLLLDLLPVLEFIHNRGVIHRDLKPENIMRRIQDSRLVLIDFGVAQKISLGRRTVSGTKVGSPGYFSLEQFSEGKATISSDLYSLGATIFHLMSGLSPSDLWTTQGYGWVKDWEKPLPQPLDQNLFRVINKLLQINVEDRYQSTSEVLADILANVMEPQVAAPFLAQDLIIGTPSPLIHSTHFRKTLLDPLPSFLKPLSHPTIVVAEFTGSHPFKSIRDNFRENRRRFLKLFLLGGVGWGSAVLLKTMGRGSTPSSVSSKLRLKSAQKTPQPPPPKIQSPPGASLVPFEFEVVNVNAIGKLIERRQHSAQFFSENLGRATILEMVAIPGGTYQMGSPLEEWGRLSHEGPQHEVKVAGFYMGKFQITQAQWQAIMGSNPSNFNGAQRPVERVSWIDAMEFCRRLSQKSEREYRLPSEAEWEYACRAGTKTPFYFGETITTDLANYRGTDISTEATFDSGEYSSGPKGQYRQQTLAVGSFPANAFGLYDMHANVLEWCQDTWQGSYTGAPVDGSAWIEHPDRKALRIVRGGSWVNIAKVCRSASRAKYYPNYKNNAFGIRVVCSMP